ncbi:MAG: glycerol-3-phosphate 1-O-acyltransferase PlsY [Sagittula sp.]|jgi:glycerol-3-phosphate acyltransferase PlsY|uniref:glycerol-3-phosphate 1-O-acyltransferase PlsY n=1 Tax=unclassified Sagittula TaxID=2624628 RepID=UPI0024C2C343|nr:glycerol-3-phosphate 1-O-acyltransferase PlsY [Sagittula sp. MA-2]WHZ34621.1 glycerol-3-phosphate 1-O-acyltransferase PlsY [Sagittula sp. MA-2]
MTLLIWTVLGYLLGSVPFGIVMTRAMGLGDLRQIGSGNIGATNVLRTGSKPAALATLILDSGKGAIAVLLARWLSGDDSAAQLAGLAAMLGHCFPVWLGFRGGKGMATFLGTMLALAWPVGLLCCATWAVAFAISRISSVGALASVASVAPWTLVMGRTDLTITSLILTFVVLYRHKDNITRLRAGTEPKVGKKS